MENNDINSTLVELQKLESEAFAEMMNLPGWEYRDLPRMTPELMIKFQEIVGLENLRWITFADYGTSQRGQVMISPDGIAKLSELANSQS